MCDIRSWPGGKGNGKGGISLESALKAYGITDEESKTARVSPIYKLKPIADAKIPILHVVGAVDKVVPVEENSDIIEKRYKELGGDIEVISKPGIGHHPHALKDPKPIVDFILKHTSLKLVSFLPFISSGIKTTEARVMSMALKIAMLLPIVTRR